MGVVFGFAVSVWLVEFCSSSWSGQHIVSIWVLERMTPPKFSELLQAPAPAADGHRPAILCLRPVGLGFGPLTGLEAKVCVVGPSICEGLSKAMLTSSACGGDAGARARERQRERE